VDYSSETISHDIVAHDRYNENERLYYSQKHKCYYFQNLQDDEMIVFQQMDSDMEGGGGEQTSFLLLFLTDCCH